MDDQERARIKAEVLEEMRVELQREVLGAVRGEIARRSAGMAVDLQAYMALVDEIQTADNDHLVDDAAFGKRVREILAGWFRDRKERRQGGS